MRIRFYQPSTVKKYGNALKSFLNWCGGPPHRITREDVREYLLYLVDAHLGSSTVSMHLLAIRNAFDKMCHRQVTLGLTSPLDVLSKRLAVGTVTKPPDAPSVGRLRIHFQPQPSDRPESRHAKVTLEIQTDVRPVYLTGILAHEVRRG